MNDSRVPTSDCRDARGWTQARLDGELDRSLESTLDGHLARCSDCRAFVTELHQLKVLIREVGVTLRPASRLTESRSDPRYLAPGRGLRAIAASLLLGLGLFLTWVIAPRPVSPEPVRSVPFEVYADSEDLLVVPIKSTNPNVHIVWLYQTNPNQGVSP